VDPTKLGIHLTTVDSDHYCYGDSNDRLSIQSIAKDLFLTLALKIMEKELWHSVSVEPSVAAFNSLVQLEYEKGISRNPFINAVAIVICDILVSHLKNPKTELLKFIRKSSDILSIGYCSTIVESEKETGYRNFALTNFMKRFGNIHNEVDVVLNLYFQLSSIEMSCKELS
jgi:glutaminase